MTLLPRRVTFLSRRFTSTAWLCAGMMPSIRRFHSSSVISSSIKEPILFHQSHVVSIQKDEDMTALGAAMSDIFCPGDIVFLQGDLGAGKTTFVRGLIRALDSSSDLAVPSPTYLLANRYPLPSYLDANGNPLPSGVLVHADLYRLPVGSDLTFLGLPQMVEEANSEKGGTNLLFVEWPDRLKESIMPSSYAELNFNINTSRHEGRDMQDRNLTIRWFGEQWRTSHHIAEVDKLFEDFRQEGSSVFHKAATAARGLDS